VNRAATVMRAAIAKVPPPPHPPTPSQPTGAILGENRHRARHPDRPLHSGPPTSHQPGGPTEKWKIRRHIVDDSRSWTHDHKDPAARRVRSSSSPVVTQPPGSRGTPRVGGVEENPGGGVGRPDGSPRRGETPRRRQVLDPEIHARGQELAPGPGSHGQERYQHLQRSHFLISRDVPLWVAFVCCVWPEGHF